MVQVITGQLVESFDEEFRTLYARSSVPSSFAPELVRVNSRKTLWDNDTYQHSVSSLASVSSQRNLFGRQDKVLKIDPVWKTRGRYAVNEIDKYGLRNQAYNKQPFNPGFNVQNPIQQYQPSEKTSTGRDIVMLGRSQKGHLTYCSTELLTEPTIYQMLGTCHLIALVLCHHYEEDMQITTICPSKVLLISSHDQR